VKIERKNECRKLYLPVSGSIWFNGPTCFVAKGFEDFVVVAVFGEFEVSIHPQTCEDLRCYGSSSSLSSLVVLSLLPRG